MVQDFRHVCDVSGPLCAAQEVIVQIAGAAEGGSDPAGDEVACADVVCALQVVRIVVRLALRRFEMQPVCRYAVAVTVEQLCFRCKQQRFCIGQLCIVLQAVAFVEEKHVVHLRDMRRKLLSCMQHMNMQCHLPKRIRRDTRHTFSGSSMHFLCKEPSFCLRRTFSGSSMRFL